MMFARFCSLAFVFFLSFLPLSSYSFTASEIKNADPETLVKRLIDLSGSGNETLIVPLVNELTERSDKKIPNAMFWWGWYQLQYCNEGYKLNLPNLDTSPMCTKAFQNVLSVAENEKIRILWLSTASMDLVAEMRFKGIGVKRSSFIAAEWYVRSGNQKFLNLDREGALISLERALEIIPDYPQALELRNKIIK